MTGVMSGVTTLYRSSIGKKAIMAITGLVYVGFVIGHMAGNLKIYTGQQHLNQYAGFLRVLGSPLFPDTSLLWVARIVLIVALSLHILMAYQLRRDERAARPVAYDTKRVVQASIPSRYMGWGGITLFLFIIFHILHFTLGVVGYAPAGQPGAYIPENPNDGYSTYQNVVTGFQSVPVSLFYILAMIALGMHLYHGSWSMFQTLGLNNTRYNRFFRYLATGIAAVVFLGNISIPIAVLLGILHN